ncbi:hypothetical protein J6590_062551 [Homalodisca vitripennis]|nr:hypothetical protein J6590_062551 [Homalodisca vitripennis]
MDNRAIFAIFLHGDGIGYGLHRSNHRRRRCDSTGGENEGRPEVAFPSASSRHSSNVPANTCLPCGRKCMMDRIAIATPNLFPILLLCEVQLVYP